VARQGADRGVGQEIQQADLPSQAVAQQRLHLGEQQRVAAQVEEILIAADPRHVQDLAPDAGHGVFERTAPLLGRQVAEDRGGRRQGLAIHLAVGRRRERCEPHDRRGHHGAGQPLAQLVLERAARLAGHGVFHHIGDQLPVPRHHHRLADPGQRYQRRLDLAGLDALAADLDLVVHPAEELDLSVAAPAAEVSRAIEPLAGAPGVGQEPFRRAAGVPQVTAGQGGPAHPQLPGHPRRHGLQGPVQQMDPQAVDGPAEGEGGVESRAGHHRRLGRAVVVDQGETAPRLRLEAKAVASHQQPAQGRNPRSPAGEERLGERGGQEGDGDAALGHPGGQPRRVQAQLLRG
jgi:hypothetical protein